MNDIDKSTGLIPDSLLQRIKKGDRVLFLGADLPLGYPHAPLSRPQLAATLAKTYDLPTGLSWPRTAQEYLNRINDDRNGLITFVRDHGSAPQVRPGPLHTAIAQAGFRAIVTAWYDELLEEALRTAGYRVNRVVRDEQLAYAEEGTREAIVIKLFGCLSDPDSLVLNPWDHAELMDRLDRKLEIVTAFCALRPPLFVGFDLAADLPRRLYIRASRNMVEHMKRAYAVWPQDLAPLRAAWRGKNVAFIRADAAQFLEALSAQLPSVGPAPGGPQRVDRPPYKFLDYYTPADAAIFCGRDTESQIVTRLALSHRLLTLFGPSGAGKTSLLLAGLAPRLAAEQYQHVYVRALDDPLPALRKAVAARAGRDDWQSGADLNDFFSRMLAPQNKLVIILDQFEELFLRVGSRQREAFFRELAAALTHPPREVRVIFSLREDYLAHLDEARSYLPGVFGNSFRLAALARDNARVAITEPAARAGIIVEPGLVDALVGAKARGVDSTAPPAGDLVQADGHVPPAAMQIVLDRLYRDALPPGHDLEAAPPPGLTLTLDAYRAVRHQLGDGATELQGAEAILAAYVAVAVERLAALQQPDRRTPLGADPELGQAILKVMVTSQKTKAALTGAELLAGLEEVGALQAADPADRVLARQTRRGLEQVRLLRGFERDGLAYYELAHDHLAAEIATWISKEEMQAKLARELLRREMDNWRSSAGLLIRPEVLALIHERRDDLQRLGLAELELLFRSALAAGYEVSYWFARAQQAEVDVATLARQGLHSASYRSRTAAVNALGQLSEAFADDLLAMLADDYPQVRVAAIHALERLRPDCNWHAHLKYECFVSAGPFIMGDDRGDSDEKPAHEVHVDAYYSGKYPVTNAAYKRYMDDIKRVFDIPRGKENHPVVNMRWYDARDYAAWAGMRLLTEAEWEKAATWAASGRRGGKPGQKRKYPWGDTFDKNKCNTKESGRKKTTPVDQHSPQGDSPYGVADMAGNVWEWTSSLYKDYPYNADDGREDQGDTGRRIMRGSSFYNNEERARGVSRYHFAPDLVYDDDYGLRCGVVSRLFSSPAGC